MVQRVSITYEYETGASRAKTISIKTTDPVLHILNVGTGTVRFKSDTFGLGGRTHGAQTDHSSRR
jgi:hypothetical protein